MPQINFSFAQDPNTLALALVYGMVPAILWLFFWLHEKDRTRSRTILFTKVFIGGILAVIAVLPVEQYVATLSSDSTVLTVLWAASEEVLKFLVFAIFVLPSASINEPVDYPLSLMVIALAFAGFENALYFLQPLQSGNTVVFALAADLRFLGTTLLHALASSLAGFAIGIAYFKSKWTKFLYGALGLLAGIGLHSMFNLLIAQNSGADSFRLFGLLWVVAVIIMLLYEALRRMGSEEYRKNKKDKAVAKIQARFRAFCSAEHILPSAETPLADIFAGRKIAPNDPEYRSLSKLIADLRSMYAGYLASQGVPKNKAWETALSLIPDAISGKSVSGVIALLSGASIGSLNDIPGA